MERQRRSPTVTTAPERGEPHGTVLAGQRYPASRAQLKPKAEDGRAVQRHRRAAARVGSRTAVDFYPADDEAGNPYVGIRRASPRGGDEVTTARPVSNRNLQEIGFALVLNLHQPAGNLERLLATQEWAAKEILWAIDRIPRSLWPFEDLGRVHLSLSGTLLETLSDPAFQQRVYGTVDCGSLLWYLQNTRTIDILGTAFYHPVLPLIPPADWPEQLERWHGLASHLFHRSSFAGFWPPEMGFTMELIPSLRRLGYRYVLVDSEHVEPLSPMRWEEIHYRPHLAQFGGEQIIVVVRDRELSEAQRAGCDADWFLREVQARTRHCEFPPLVTTATDGENGGWFRNTTPGANFWTAFHADLLDRVGRGQAHGLRPTFIHDYLDRHGAHDWVDVGPGVWTTGRHHGTGFVQWTGSLAQQQALTRVGELSQAVHAARRNASGIGSTDPELYAHLDQALWLVLRAEASCNFFWGEDWVGECHRDLDLATQHLDAAGACYR